jgi:hypothetical protein
VVVRSEPEYQQGEMPVLPPRDPLKSGVKATWTLYGSRALKKEIERQAAIDGYESVSAYTIDLLIAAVRARELERSASETKR